MMRGKAFRLVTIGLFLGLLGLLFAQLAGSTPVTDELPNQSEKVNLALRRTAHHLLRMAGDSTSRIPAIQKTDTNTYCVQLGRAFDYDQLPHLLRQSLQFHHITSNYTVAVLDCATLELQLGYTMADLTGKEPVPCGGRSMMAGCYILKVSFDSPAPVSEKQPTYWPFLALAGLLSGFVVVVWRQRDVRVEEPVTQPDPEGALPTEATTQLRFGQSCLDVSNQTLTVDGQIHNLTYRETKLLRVMVSHVNQVMDRDRILELVWEDEGVTVGRSVDVFISRLRKLLRQDQLVKITAVHGVGYRMDVLAG